MNPLKFLFLAREMEALISHMSQEDVNQGGGQSLSEGPKLCGERLPHMYAAIGFPGSKPPRPVFTKHPHSPPGTFCKYNEEKNLHRGRNWKYMI